MAASSNYNHNHLHCLPSHCTAHVHMCIHSLRLVSDSYLAISMSKFRNSKHEDWQMTINNLLLHLQTGDWRLDVDTSSLGVRQGNIGVTSIYLYYSSGNKTVQNNINYACWWYKISAFLTLPTSYTYPSCLPLLGVPQFFGSNTMYEENTILGD